MSAQAVAIGVELVGSLIGGNAAKQDAKRKAAFQRSQVLRKRGYDIEDNKFSSNDLQSRIMSSAGASGVRGSSGSVQSVKSDEMLKSGRRRERILAGSEAELQMIAMNLKSEKKSANLDMAMAVGDAATSYYGG